MLITLSCAFLLCCAGLFSCKKETVATPNVTILQPSQNSSYAFGDTIFVKAEVYHKDLARVNLTLVDQNFNSVEPILQLPVNGNNAYLNDFVVVANKTITSGKHHIRIQVIAAGESFNFFQQVQVQGIQQELRAVYIATSDSFTRQLHRIENGQSTLSKTLPGDFSGMATNSLYDGVYMAPNYVGDLKLYKPLNDSLVWTDQNNASNGAAFMTGLYNTNTAVYGFYYQPEQVVRFGNTGLKQQIFPLPVNARALEALLVDDRLVVLTQTPPTLNIVLLFFSATTGSLLQSVPLPQIAEHIALQPFGQDEMAVFFNNAAGHGVLRVYDKRGQEINVQALPPLVLKSAVAVNGADFVLGTDQGTVLFKTGTAGLTTLSSIPATTLAFEALQSSLYLGSGNSLWVYQFPSMTLRNTHSFGQPLKAISFLYNK